MSKISIVISAYNESENIDKLYAELVKTTGKLKDVTPEFIFVNDGSTDDTLTKCRALQHKDKRVKIVNFERNFGHEKAMTAGMDYATGDAIIFMDADLQHPPHYIEQMVRAWQKGEDIVLTRRLDNADTSRFYKLCAGMFYKMLNWLSDTKIPEKMPDFRLIDKKYADFLKKFHEQDRLFRGLLSCMVDIKKVKVIEFVAPERFAGSSKYNFSKSMRLAIDALVQFSTRPLRLSVYLGVLTALFAGGLGIYVVIEHFVLHRPDTGYATIMTAVTMIGAIQLIVLGIVGEYIGKIHMEVKNRPLYYAEIIEEKNETNTHHKRR